MRSASRIVSCLSVPICALALLVAPARADERQPADLLPDTVVIYAEVAKPKELIAVVVEHPVYARLAASEDYQKALERPEVVQFRAAVAFVELQIGRTWRSALDGLMGGGVAVALDGKTESGVLLARSDEPGLLDKTRDTLIKLAREDAKKKENPDPIKSAEYRGIQAFEINNVSFATFDGWLLVCQKGELGKNIIDRYLDNGGANLAASERFQQAREQKSSAASAWAFVDVEKLRSAGVAPELFGGKAKDFGGELILGGLLANLAKTPYATAEWKLDGLQATLTLATPHDPSWIDEQREYFFGPGGEGRAPQLINVPGTILALSAYRDVSGMWIRAGDLFNQEVNDQLAQADNTLTTLFSGRDFGEDILGAIHPEVQLVVVRQTFEADQPTPAIKFPSFALIARLKEPERMRTELRRTFQSLIGFLNIVGAMNGQPQLDLHDEQIGDGLLVTAKYAPDVDRQQQTDAPINFNFSPCVAFAGSHVIVSSTVQLSRQLVDAVGESAESEAGVNTLASADITALRQVLNDNRSHLISQQMLEKGQSREEAEKEIGTLFAILEQIGKVDFQFTAKDRLQLQLNVSLEPNP